MNLPDGYTWRPATRDDVRTIFDLVVAVDVEEYGEPDYDESDVVDEFDRDGFDLARDTWLVLGPGGAAAAYAAAYEKDPGAVVVSDTYVHPDAPDLYPWLVGRVSERAAATARGSGRVAARVFSSEPNRRRAAAAIAAGFEVARVFRRMEAPLLDPVPAPSLAPGVVVRPATADDLRDVWRVQQESFSEHFGSVREPYETWHRQFVATESYRPDLWWVAEVDGAVAGILVGQAHEDKGWVKTVGVLREARGRGVASALLLTAFAAFREAGFDKVGLGVDSDNTTGAMGLYERLGMTATHRYDLYERVFTGS